MSRTSKHIPTEVFTCRHGQIAHFAEDQCIGASLRAYGEWAEEEIAFVVRLLEGGATVIDVGANVGTHSLAFARVVGPTGSVIALEAHPDTFCLLAHNIVHNNALGTIQPFHCIAADTAGLVTWNFVPAVGNSGTSSFRSLSPPAAGSVRLPQIPLGEFGLRHCDLIKIDVEGMELAVLRGAADTLQRLHPYLYFEHASGDAEQLGQTLTFLRELGYDLFWHLTNPFNCRNFRGTTHNIFGGSLELNVFAQRRELPAPGLPRVDDPLAIPARPPLTESVRGVSVVDYLPPRRGS